MLSQVNYTSVPATLRDLAALTRTFIGCVHVCIAYEKLIQYFDIFYYYFNF